MNCNAGIVLIKEECNRVFDRQSLMTFLSSSLSQTVLGQIGEQSGKDVSTCLKRRVRCRRRRRMEGMERSQLQAKHCRQSVLNVDEQQREERGKVQRPEKASKGERFRRKCVSITGSMLL